MNIKISNRARQSVDVKKRWRTNKALANVAYNYNLLQEECDMYQPVRTQFDYTAEYLYHWNYIGMT